MLSVLLFFKAITTIQKERRWEEDLIVWFFCDVERELEGTKGDKFEQELCELSNVINEKYKKAGSDQAEVWISVHRVYVMQVKR